MVTYVLAAESDVSTIEYSLASMLLINGLTGKADADVMLSEMRDGINQTVKLFRGVRIDTGASTY